MAKGEFIHPAEKNQLKQEKQSPRLFQQQDNGLIYPARVIKKNKETYNRRGGPQRSPHHSIIRSATDYQTFRAFLSFDWFQYIRWPFKKTLCMNLEQLLRKA